MLIDFQLSFHAVDGQNNVLDRVHYMDVSENSGTPKSSILIGFSIINHPFWGTPIFGNTHINGCAIGNADDQLQLHPGIIFKKA